MYRFESEYDTVINVEHWTSATAGGGADGNLMWCNGKTSLNIQETNWKSGQPNLADGKCVFVQFSNRTANLTTFSLGDCAQKRKFLCEVITLGFFLTSSLYLTVCSAPNRKNWLCPMPTSCRQSACFYLESQMVSILLQNYDHPNFILSLR
jgi:hypothetical protein